MAFVDTRRSRWTRDRTYGEVRIGPRDVEIFKLLSRYRYLRKSYIDAFLGGNPFAMQTRLGELFRTREHYLERPQQQRQYFNANYRPMIYELGEGGKELLARHGLTQTPMATFKNVYNEFGHLVMLCDVLANLELGARANGCELVPQKELIRFPVSISDKINGRIHTSRTPVTPDAVFAVRYPDGSTLHFALEVDCGTEPLKRSNLEQTSYHRKLLQYRELLRSGAFKNVGLPRLWICHVTNTESRLRMIMEMTGASKSNMFRHLSCLGDYAPDPKPDPSFFGKWARNGFDPFDFKK